MVVHDLLPMAEFTVSDVIQIELDCLQRWIDLVEEDGEEEMKNRWMNVFSFTPPESFLRLLTVMPPDFGFSIGYHFQFIDPCENMVSTFCYTESFQEFYSLTELIPILDHGSGRNYDLYDCKTGAIIQFNIIDSPSEWIVLATSFDEVAMEYYRILKRIQEDNTPPPNSIYEAEGKEFKTLLEVFPDRARELDGILPNPLVLRTHQPGTWQIDKIEKIHEIIQNCDSGDITELKAYLDANPKHIRHQTSKKSEPLHEACRLGRITCLEYLLQRIQEESGLGGLKAALSAKDNALRTPLIIACENLMGNPNVARCLEIILSYGSDIVDVNSAQDEGQTALHYVASSGYPYFVKRLLELGADVHCRDQDTYGGNTPLHSLCRMRGGASDDQVSGRLSSDLSPQYSFHPTERSCLHCLVLLVNAGADVNAPTIGQNSTPLHLMMWGSGMEDCTKMIEFLCENGANVTAKTSSGVSVLESGFAREKYLDVLERYGAPNEGKKRKKHTTKTITQNLTGQTKAQPILKTANAVMGMTANEAAAKALDG